MSAKTGRSLFLAMRDRKKVYYGRGRKAPLPAAGVASAQTPQTEPTKPDNQSVEAAGVDTPAPAPLSRLDRQQTIELAKATLQQICLASDSPSNAKATAARTLLELVGALGRHADPTSMNTLPASEMSLEQLEARIAALVSH
jgi:hypothetical protein